MVQRLSIVIFACSALAACGAIDKPQGPLAQQLADKVEASKSMIPPEDMAVLAQAQREVAESGVVDRAKRVGDTAPGFALPDANGQPTALADLLASGPAVVTFYRGHW